MKLFVGNMAYSVTEDHLREMFSAHGPIESIELITDRFSGQPKGFAFVQMESNRDADQAIKALNGSQLAGRPVVVNQVQKQKNKQKRRR